MPETLTQFQDPSPDLYDGNRTGGENMGFSSVSEIEEENSSEVFDFRPETIKEEFEGGESSSGVKNGDGEDVYVAVGKSDSSLDALGWTLKQGLAPSGFVYLVHVFPEVRYIPTPLGKIAKSQLSPEQVESYMNQERSKRREILNKLLNMCHAYKVNVDTILIESDVISKAVLELIPVLNIRKLVVGTSKSSLRKSRKGSGMAYQILKNAPDTCEVKIICEGNQVNDHLSSPRSGNDSTKVMRGDPEERSISCPCFSSKVL